MNSTHGVAEEHQEHVHMGLPLPNGKLAIWLFLITEIMFFTALIGVYLILRNGPPSAAEPWPTPADVHLEEWIGAFNTFVLICSSVTVVLAHWALHKHNVKRAVQFIGVTLALGDVFAEGSAQPSARGTRLLAQLAALAFAHPLGTIEIFVARKLTLKAQKLDAGEFLEVFSVPFAEAVDMIRDGRITDAKTVSALLLVDRWFRNK